MRKNRNCTFLLKSVESKFFFRKKEKEKRSDKIVTPKIKPPPALGTPSMILIPLFSSKYLVHEKIKKEKAKEKKKDKEKEEKTGLRRLKSLSVASNFVAFAFQRIDLYFQGLVIKLVKNSRSWQALSISFKETG